jgi:hypothetical protein
VVAAEKAPPPNVTVARAIVSVTTTPLDFAVDLHERLGRSGRRPHLAAAVLTDVLFAVRDTVQRADPTD